MLKRAALVCCAVSSAVFVWAQAPPKIDPGSQPAVDQLAAIARTIKECPRELRSERKQGKELERHYIGPPQNVVWDVVPSNSVRSPYLGYIEFLVEFTRWDSSSGIFRDELLTLPAPRRRCEFDVGPRGLELARMLHYGGPVDEFRNVLFDESADDSCWQKAARSPQPEPGPVPKQGMPNQIITGDHAPPQIDAGSQSAVATLRTVAQVIKECPRALSSEEQWGKRAEEIERWYVGPPQNVIWDVVPGTSARSPYVAYIEFSLGWDYWVEATHAPIVPEEHPASSSQSETPPSVEPNIPENRPKNSA